MVVVAVVAAIGLGSLYAFLLITSEPPFLLSLSLLFACNLLKVLHSLLLHSLEEGACILTNTLLRLCALLCHTCLGLASSLCTLLYSSVLGEGGQAAAAAA